MQQQRYYAEHHDTSPDEQSNPSDATPTSLAAQPGSRRQSPFARGTGLPEFIEPGPQVGDTSSVRFLASRKLRRIHIEGPSPLVLSINGRAVQIVQPGDNSFDPPVALEAGDTLQLEVVEHRAAESLGALSGWTPALSLDDECRARGGRHV